MAGRKSSLRTPLQSGLKCASLSFGFPNVGFFASTLSKNFIFHSFLPKTADFSFCIGCFFIVYKSGFRQRGFEKTCHKRHFFIIFLMTNQTYKALFLPLFYIYKVTRRDVAQLVEALGSGPRGGGSNPSHSDHFILAFTYADLGFFLLAKKSVKFCRDVYRMSMDVYF